MTDLLRELLPDVRTGLWAAGAAALAVVVVGVFAARLRARGVRVAYTRKVFHFGIFSTAAAVHATLGLGGTNVYGGLVALVVLWSVARGEGNGLFEALARDTDRPRRGLFVVVPLVTTAVGGLAAALLTGPFASVGYLVAGWGDAVGEPVGARWGRHPYRVPSLAGVPARRTLEGSAAVAITAVLAAFLALTGLGFEWPTAAGVGLAVGLTAAAVEAVSHHGTDNLTVQLAASLLAWALLR